MSVPEAIRKIPRPVNTVVVDNGKDSPLRYAVRTRLRSRYVPGKNPRPRNGRVIGHITDGRFVPLREEPATPKNSLLSYGACALIRTLTSDLYTQLSEVYDPALANAVMTAASLRVLRPAAAPGRGSWYYLHSYLSRFYPDTNLSSTAVKTLLKTLGAKSDRRLRFYHLRASASSEHCLTLAIRRAPAEYSASQKFYNFPATLAEEVPASAAVLYAYDLESLEPVWAEVFQNGNIEPRDLELFLGIPELSGRHILLSRDFTKQPLKPVPPRQTPLLLVKPLKRKHLRSYCGQFSEWDGPLDSPTEQVQYKMFPLKDGEMVCLFRDPRTAAAAAAAAAATLNAETNRKKLKGSGPADEPGKKAQTGLCGCSCTGIVPPETLRLFLAEKKLRELILRYCAPPEVPEKREDAKTNEDEGNDAAAAGAEFISFIAAIIAGRILRKAAGCGQLQHHSLGELLDRLCAVHRSADAPYPPRNRDGYWVNQGGLTMEELENLGLCGPAPAPKTGKSRRTPNRGKTAAAPQPPAPAEDPGDGSSRA